METVLRSMKCPIAIIALGNLLNRLTFVTDLGMPILPPAHQMCNCFFDISYTPQLDNTVPY